MASDLIQPDGDYWGKNIRTGSFVMVDRFSFPAPHMVVIAPTGSGKSYFIKIQQTQARFKGLGTIIIDPSDKEYRRWCDAFGGQYVRLSVASPDKVNPLAILVPADDSRLEEEERRPVTQKVAYLKDLLHVMLNGLTPEELALLDQTIYGLYRDFGIEDNWESVLDQGGGGLKLGGRGTKPMPILGDLLATIKKTPGAERLATLLEPFVGGSLSIFNGQTTVDLQNDLVVFDVHTLVSKNSDDPLAPTAYFILTEFIMQKLRETRRRKIVTIDEAHFLLANPVTARFLEHLYRTARKVNGAVTVITQRTADFDAGTDGHNKAAADILANAHIAFLMAHTNPRDVARSVETFGLSEAEAQFLGTAMRGEGLLVTREARIEVLVKAWPELHPLITTDADELAAMEAKGR